MVLKAQIGGYDIGRVFMDAGKSYGGQIQWLMPASELYAMEQFNAYKIVENRSVLEHAHEL
jgi:hypothetical protein